MPNVKPVSDLRSYHKVLRDVAIAESVFFAQMAGGAMRS